jgi:hypothetical protein
MPMRGGLASSLAVRATRCGRGLSSGRPSCRGWGIFRALPLALTQRGTEDNNMSYEIDDFINNQSAPTAAWLRSHKEWITDPNKNNHLTEAHFNAVRVLGQSAVDTPGLLRSCRKVHWVEAEQQIQQRA